MKLQITLAALSGLHVAAFPAVLNNVLSERQVPSTQGAQALSKARTNCGPTPCVVFDGAEQKVSTTGAHAYASPGASQIRGPCPGLNAAANHGYLSRSGVTTLPETVSGLGQLYGMSADLAGFLAAYAILIDGNPIAGTWSIGGPPPPTVGTALLGEPPGISYSHNNYEGDSSIGRRDAYLNHGDAHSLDVNRFRMAYEATEGKDRYTLDGFAQDFSKKSDQSIANNPYYFAAPFSTTLVAPAAYNFVINFMSNHSAEEPNGYLDGYQLKKFFAVTGDYPIFKWQKGQERIPENWYRRTSAVQYNAASVLEDLAIQFAAYPSSFRLGGNTNGVNTYTGVDLTDLTGGAYNAGQLTDPNNTQGAACFYAQALQAITPSFANKGAKALSAATNLLDTYIKPFAGATNCPPINKYNAALFSKYPGYSYNPKGPANNY